MGSAELDNFGIEHKAVGWIPTEEIAKGDVSIVFKVLSSADGKTFCAMKVEKLGKGVESKNIEKDVLAAFRDDPNSLQLVDYCYVGKFRCTIMSLAGPDFNSIRTLMNKKFSDSTMIRLAIRSLMAIKSLHEHCYLHRDLEPPNIALSTDPNSRNVFLVDFGAARQYARCEGGKWLLRAPRDKVPFRGSVQYCSPKMHDLEEVGRVDDLWSWLYIFAEMRVYLPWTDSTHACKFAPRKRNLIDEVLEEDAFLKTFLPIAALLKTYKYPDRPDYLKIFEILSAKMEEMGVKWMDPMDYDLILERNFRSSKTPAQDEKIIAEHVATAFSTVVVPGGQQYVMKRHSDFFAKVKKEEKKDKKTKEREKKKKMTKEVTKEVTKETTKEVTKEATKGNSKEVIEKKETEKSMDMPSKSAEMASKQKVNKTGKKVIAVKKTNTKTSSTSSASRQSSTSPGKEPIPISLAIPIVPTKIEKVKVASKGQKVKI